MCGSTEEQSIPAVGSIPSDGGRPSASRCKGLRGPGGDGGRVDRPAVRGPLSALAMGAKRPWTGRLVVSAILIMVLSAVCFVTLLSAIFWDVYGYLIDRSTLTVCECMLSFLFNRCLVP
jgi:hypothetical protein